MLSKHMKKKNMKNLIIFKFVIRFMSVSQIANSHISELSISRQRNLSVAFINMCSLFANRRSQSSEIEIYCHNLSFWRYMQRGHDLIYETHTHT